MTASAPSGAMSGVGTPSGYNLKQIPNFTPEMMNIYQQLTGAAGPGAQEGLGYLSRLAGGDEGAFADREKSAFTNFDKLTGQLASRFSGVGARDSSAFQNAITGAAGNLAQDLSSQRGEIQENAIDKLMNQINKLMGISPYENVLQPKKNNNSNAMMMDLVGKLLPALIDMFAGTGGAVSAGANVLQSGLGK